MTRKGELGPICNFDGIINQEIKIYILTIVVFSLDHNGIYTVLIFYAQLETMTTVYQNLLNIMARKTTF